MYYGMDVYAHVLNWDKGLPPAKEWIKQRAARILTMQARHPDGHMYAQGEFDKFKPREQFAANALAQAYLLLWLNAHGALGKRGNWLADPP